MAEHARERLRGIVALRLRVPALESEISRLRAVLRALLIETAQHAEGDCAKLRQACKAARNMLRSKGVK